MCGQRLAPTERQQETAPWWMKCKKCMTGFFALFPRYSICRRFQKTVVSEYQAASTTFLARFEYIFQKRTNLALADNHRPKEAGAVHHFRGDPLLESGPALAPSVRSGQVNFQAERRKHPSSPPKGPQGRYGTQALQPLHGQQAQGGG